MIQDGGAWQGNCEMWEMKPLRVLFHYIYIVMFEQSQITYRYMLVRINIVIRLFFYIILFASTRCIKKIISAVFLIISKYDLYK